MDIKYNIATYNRPDGSRLLDAPWVYTDLETIREQLKSEHAWNKNDRNGITIFKAGKMTIVLTIMKAGAVIKRNSVDGFLTLHVLRGKALVETEDCPVVLTAGNILNFHPCIVHNIIAKEETEILFNTFNV